MPKTLKRKYKQKRKTQKGGIFNYLRNKFRKNSEMYEKPVINENKVINEKFLKEQMKNFLDNINKNIEKEKNKVHLKESEKLKKFADSISKESTKLRILQEELNEKSKKIEDMITEIEGKKDNAVKIYEIKKGIIEEFAMAIQYKTKIDLNNELLSILKNDKDLLLLKKQVDFYLDNLAQEEKIKKRKNVILERETSLNKEIFGEEYEEKRPTYYSTPLSVYNNSLDKEILKKQHKIITPKTQKTPETPETQKTPVEIRIG
jgi:hypothetical protein